MQPVVTRDRAWGRPSGDAGRVAAPLYDAAGPRPAESSSISPKRQSRATAPATAEDAGAGAHDSPVDLGPRLLSARLERGISIGELARASGLSKGYISQVERNLAVPSIAALFKICNALAITVSSLFEPESSPLIRRTERQPVNFGGVRIVEHLLTPSTERRIQAIESRIAPGGGGGDEPYALSAEIEFVLVQSGRLEVELHGKRYVLRRGDALTFPGGATRKWRNPSTTQSAIVLWVLAPAAY